MNAAQLAEIQRQANGDPNQMLNLIVDHHIANTYGGDINAYVDSLARNVDRMTDAQSVMGTLPFFLALEARGADEANLTAALERVRAKLASFRAPPPAAGVGARRRAKTGRRGKKGTRRGRR
jgi:hypothetical protein